MDKSTHNIRRANWLNIVTQCQNRPNGITAKQWLEDNDISEKSYYYWLRKFRKEISEHMQGPAITEVSEVAFAEITMPTTNDFSGHTTKSVGANEPVAIIRCNGLIIELSNDISDMLLSRILQEVSHA